MKKKKKYVVIFGGHRVRLFRDLTFLCETLHLDYEVLGYYLRERGWWCGLEFHVYMVEEESRERNLGKL